MKDAVLKISVTNGKSGADERGWSVETRYVNLGPDESAIVSGFMQEVQTAASKLQKGSGDLTATLDATIDGVAQPALTYSGTDWKAVTKAQRDVYKAADRFLKRAETKHKL